jgi:hypothetical protein
MFGERSDMGTSGCFEGLVNDTSAAWLSSGTRDGGVPRSLEK